MNDEFDRTRYTILAVDDDVGILHLIAKRLLRENIAIKTVDNVDAALESIMLKRPDLLILDYLLKERRCTEILDTLHKSNIEIPFIVMTGHGDEKIAVEMMKLGARDYLIKDTSLLDFLPTVVMRNLNRLALEEELAESQKNLSDALYRYYRLFESSTDSIIFTSKEGQIIDFNNSFVDMLGYSEQELKKLNIIDIYRNPADRQIFISKLEKEGKVIDFEVEFIRKDGSVIFCLLRATLMRDANNNITGYQGFIRDITKQKKAELEIHQLNEHLNQRVKERTAQLEDALEEIKFEIEEKKRTECILYQTQEELAATLAKEIELNELKTRFISMVSHEYRTPLTVILSSTYLIEQSYHTNNREKFEKHLRKIRYSVQEMTDLLEDILFIGKTDAHKTDYKAQKINIISFIEDSIEELKIIDEKGHHYIFQPENDNIEISSDSRYLHQVLMNLLSNASKYSPENSTIRVELKERVSEIEICVNDEGIGIPENEMKHLFEPFHRSKNATSSGTGLGLTVVKKCIGILAGEIKVKSRVGEGSSFIVTIPKERESASKQSFLTNE